MMKSLIAATLVSLTVVACVAEDGSALNGGRGGGPNGDGTQGADGTQNPDGTNPDGTNPDGTQNPALCQGKPHIGFGNVDFVADRKPGELGENRRRIKPYSALRTEFQRALGAAPAGLTAAAASFGDTPARWYSEPVAGAVSLYSMYTLAFTTCYDTMTQAEYQAAPTQATAETECSKMARKFWQRTPTDEERLACAELVVTNTTETVARRRWAHACASLITATGFITF